MERAYHKWFSTELQRDMELLVFGHTGQAVLFFPTRMARFFDYENWGVVAGLRERLNKNQIQLFCVDSIDAESFYNKNAEPAERINRHLQYEAYILKEVVPFMLKQNANASLVVAGCSMGAFHAINLALRHPAVFKKVVAMSGRYDLTIQLENYDDLFDGFRNREIFLNTPQHFMAEMEDEHLLALIRQIDITIAIGAEDPFYPFNIMFGEILTKKSIPHKLYTWEGNAHLPRFWRQMVQLYL
ncbi:esterase family protein [Mucilaginibacter terrae]|uniref:esterase family protein n=1 Tax=Mucilaginibacter terrae TaxID=1955052 RepID=UPI00363A4267